MKKIILLLLAFCSFSSLFCQITLDKSKFDFQMSSWETFKKNKIYVLVGTEKDSVYDAVLKSSFKKYWTFNKYEFISPEKFRELSNSTNNFFLIPTKIHLSSQYNYGSSNYLDLRQGDPSGKLDKSPPLTSIQMDDDITDKQILLPLFIKHLQWYCDLVYTGKIANKKDYMALVQSNWIEIKNKPLYFSTSEFNDKIKTVNDIKKSDYSGEVFAVSKSEITGIVKQEADINVFFSVDFFSVAFDYVYNTKTGELYYYNSNNITNNWPAGIIPYHYKKWNK